VVQARQAPRITVRALVAVVIASMAVVLVGLSALALARSYYDTKVRLQSEALSAAYVVSAHVQWLVGASWQALQHVDDLIGEDVANIDETRGQAIVDVVANLPGSVIVSVFDEEGAPTFSSGDDDLDIAVANRAYFDELKAGRSFYISSLMTRRSANQMFVIAHRLERDGAFAGLATISVPALLLSDFWAELRLGPRSTVSVFRTDGWLVARFPPPEGPMNLSDYVLFTDHLPESDRGTYDAVSPVDGVSRIVGYIKIDGQPLVALASLATEETFNEFWRQTMWAGVGLLALLAILGLLVAWLLAVLRREEESRARLAAALEKNRLLFREIHHRVKNNMQAISSLVQLHPLPPEAKEDLVHRIAAMGAIHEQAYRSDEYADVSVSEYLTTLIASVKEAYGRDIEVETDLAPVTVSRDLAMPLGLVVNEVMSNTFKHAFPDERPGKVTVELRSLAEDRAELTIADNGVGFDSTEGSDGIGSRLIKGFIAQLGGDSETTANENGTRFAMRFPSLPSAG
jgi:two-component system, sensor histidine kinase PdtaS